MRVLKLSLLLSLLCLTGFSEALPPAPVVPDVPPIVGRGTTDHFNCSMRLFGSISENDQAPIINPVGPYRSIVGEELLKRWQGEGSLFYSKTDLGATRYTNIAPVRDRSFSVEYARGTLSTSLGTSGINATLKLSYYIALSEDRRRAAQYVELGGELYKNENPIIVTATGLPIEFPNPFDGSDQTFWKEIKIVNGLPQIMVDEKQYLETSSGSGLLKLHCQSGGVEIAVPFTPAPVPTVPSGHGAPVKY